MEIAVIKTNFNFLVELTLAARCFYDTGTTRSIIVPLSGCFYYDELDLARIPLNYPFETISDHAIQQ